MKSCEEYEIELSSLLDGEVWPAAADAVEHALSCAGCSEFFRASRRLQAAASGRQDQPGNEIAEPPLEAARADALWLQVRAASSEPAAGTAPAGRRWLRPLRAAALVVLGLGGGYLLTTLGTTGRASIPGTPTVAGANVAVANGTTAAPTTATTPAMDEHRFLALATELLGSDVRYQRAMLDVLRLVPALETGEGLGTEDGPRGAVRARFGSEPPRGGAI